MRLIVPVTLGPAVGSAPNGNEYQESSPIGGGKARPAVEAAASPPPVSGVSASCGSLYVSQSYTPPRPVTGIALLITSWLM
jgi:hypothetical protein